MGLDMYAFVADKMNDDGSFENPIEIAYWRKHPNTHGWMENLWRERGGVGDFNCVPLVLSGEDIEAFEKAVESGSLPETTGFFFGTSHPEYIEQDRLFIKRAKGCIAQGKIVYYDSWW